MGQLWRLFWSLDSGNPGTPNVLFVSNPALGLNDAAIAAMFQSLLLNDTVGGISTLTDEFSFSFQLLVPANSIPTFDETQKYEVDGIVNVVPEPGAAWLFAAAAGIMALSQRPNGGSRLTYWARTQSKRAFAGVEPRQ